jgi:hypothetical protein
VFEAVYFPFGSEDFGFEERGIFIVSWICENKKRSRLLLYIIKESGRKITYEIFRFIFRLWWI